MSIQLVTHYIAWELNPLTDDSSALLRKGINRSQYIYQRPFSDSGQSRIGLTQTRIKPKPEIKLSFDPEDDVRFRFAYSKTTTG
jgi:hypothetical protein